MHIIKSTAGASLIFVLAAMLFLMAIGASALAAASTGFGSDTSKQAADQLNMYAESMQKSIMYSLQTSGVDESGAIGSAETLGGQLLRAAYEEALPSGGSVTLNLELTPSLAEVPGLSSVVTVTVDTPLTVGITEGYTRGEKRDEEGNIITARKRFPQTASISGTAVVTVTANPGAALGEKSMISVITYSFSGGYLREFNEDPSDMRINSAGQWKVVSYDRLER